MGTTVSSQTAPEELAGPVHRDVDHIVNELQLRSLHGQKDHGTLATEPTILGISMVFRTNRTMGSPLRKDRDVDDHRTTATAELIGHRVNELGNLYVFLNKQDHGDQPLRKDRDVDNLR